MPAPSENLKSTIPASATVGDLLRADGPLAVQIKQIYLAAGAQRWDVSPATLAEALCRSMLKRFGAHTPSPGEAASYLSSLHSEDLALACGCIDGNPQAWEYFFQNYREVLYAAARAIVGRGSANDAQACDLADSLYADLYAGNRLDRRADGTRHSLFAYFHGRSKLSTWLRAVLSQRYVDARRAGRRTESLDSMQSHDGGDGAASAVRSRDGHALDRASAARFVSPDPDHERVVPLMQEALLSALAALLPRDRLCLALYYVQDLTLAEIGRLLGEHEATASRRLERVRKDVRRQVEELLRAKRLSDAEIDLCFTAAQKEWPFDLTGALEIEPCATTAEVSQKPLVEQRQNPAKRKDP